MPLTRSFKEFVKSRIEQDAKFRQALFQEAVQSLIEGDVETAKSVLRDYINATIGFPALAVETWYRRATKTGSPSKILSCSQTKRYHPAMTQLLERAVETVRNLPPEMQ